MLYQVEDEYGVFRYRFSSAINSCSIMSYQYCFSYRTRPVFLETEFQWITFSGSFSAAGFLIPLKVIFSTTMFFIETELVMSTSK